MRSDGAAPRIGSRIGAAARIGAVAFVGCGLLAGTAGEVGAQTPFTATGLGYPAAPVDARAAALGGVGVGLLDGSLSLRNPAELTEHRIAALGITGVAEGVDVEAAGRSFPTGRSRIPVVRALTPLGEWAVGAGFGSELDQDWSVRFQDTLEVSQGVFPFEETRESDGGVGLVELGVARRLGPLSVGVAGQRLTGSLREEFSRRFEADTAAGAIRLGNVSDRVEVSYAGWRVKVGGSFRIADRLLVGGTYAWTSDLTAETRATGEERDMGMPASWELGASARIAPSLLLTAGGGWAGWSAADGATAASARDTRWAGAGLEYTSLRWLGISLPLRAGVRTAELPFTPPGFEGQAEERALSLGFGAVFRGGAAELSAAFEVGTRGDRARDGLEESFRRLTASLVLRQ